MLVKGARPGWGRVARVGLLVLPRGFLNLATCQGSRFLHPSTPRTHDASATRRRETRPCRGSALVGSLAHLPALGTPPPLSGLAIFFRERSCHSRVPPRRAQTAESKHGDPQPVHPGVDWQLLECADVEHRQHPVAPDAARPAPPPHPAPQPKPTERHVLRVQRDRVFCARRELGQRVPGASGRDAQWAAGDAAAQGRQRRPPHSAVPVRDSPSSGQPPALQSSKSIATCRNQVPTKSGATGLRHPHLHLYVSVCQNASHTRPNLTMSIRAGVVCPRPQPPHPPRPRPRVVRVPPPGGLALRPVVPVPLSTGALRVGWCGFSLL